MDIDLKQRPFPNKLVRLWLASLRRKLSPAERKELNRLLDRKHPGRLIKWPEPALRRGRFVKE